MLAQEVDLMSSVDKATPPLSAVSGSVRFRDAFWFWLKLGVINFGGPTGQIAIMHHELVERRRWISNDRFLHALNFCMLLPGPEAQQLAIYVGWLLHRTIGGLVAGIFFVLPSFFVLLGLSWVYAVHGDVTWVEATFHGLRAAVIAIVAAAVIRIGKQSFRHPALVALAAGAFIAIFFLDVPFPAIIISTAIIGLAGGKLWPQIVRRQGHAESGESAMTVIQDDQAPLAHTHPSLRRAVAVIAVGLLAWWGPLAAVAVWRGWADVLTQEAVFFSKAAMVTFGGAYAVLAYIAQAAVEQYGWLEPGEMLDGLGMAESTPGPLIMVTEFVGLMGAFRNPGGLDPILAGTLGAIVTVWATFAPCFLWIFLGAPFMEQIRGNVLLSATLSAITAAVVGVVLNLAVWFGLHTLFRTVTERTVLALTIPIPHLGSFEPFAMLLAVVAFLGLWRFHWPVLPVVFGSIIAGFLFRAAFGL